MKLCYVHGPWAFFTDNPEPWGDDWDDAPYEHNAREPYEDGYKVVKVAYSGCFNEPCSEHTNSPFTVQSINAGAIAWLRGRNVNIQAGVDLCAW